MAAVVDRAQQEAARAVRNLPAAHASWQFWRKAKFRAALKDFIQTLYGLDVEGSSDEQLANIEDLVHDVCRVVQLHTSRMLGTDDVRDVVDREFFRNAMERLGIALEGLAAGQNPDPEKRLTDRALMDRFAAALRDSKFVA